MNNINDVEEEIEEKHDAMIEALDAKMHNKAAPSICLESVGSSFNRKHSV